MRVSLKLALAVSTALAVSASGCVGEAERDLAEAYLGTLSIADGRSLSLKTSSGDMASAAPGSAKLLFSSDELGTRVKLEALTDLGTANAQFVFELPELDSLAGTEEFFAPEETGQPAPLTIAAENPVRSGVTQILETNYYCGLQSDGTAYYGIRTTTLFKYSIALHAAFGTPSSTADSFVSVATFDGAAELVASQPTDNCQQIRK